jgi:hypothetical protein
MKTEIECPRCIGRGRLYSIHGITLSCDFCDGDGVVNEERLALRKIGNVCRRRRVYDLELGLRDFSELSGIDIGNISKMERGVMNPLELVEWYLQRNTEILEKP